jgi:VanZ family protein
MYFGAALFSIPFFTFRKNYKKSYLIAFFFSVSFGIIMELLQATITENRSADIFDVIANIIGSTVGLVGYQLFIKNRKIEKIFFRI